MGRTDPWFAPGVHHATESPQDDAERWNRFLLEQSPDAYAAAVERWTSWFAEMDLEGSASGAIVVRRDTPEQRFTACVPMRTAPTGDGGAQIDRMVANRRWLTELGPRAEDVVLASTPSLLSSCRLEQAMNFEQRWSAAAATMILTDSCGAVGAVDPLAVHAILRLDGATRVADLIEEASAATGLPVDELSGPTTSTIRDLLAAGCLSLDDPGSPTGSCVRRSS